MVSNLLYTQLGMDGGIGSAVTAVYEDSDSHGQDSCGSTALTSVGTCTGTMPCDDDESICFKRIKTQKPTEWSLTERHTVETVACGNGLSECLTGIMKKGLLYGSSLKGATSKQHWPIEFNSETMSGSPIGAFSLKTIHVRGMLSASSSIALDIDEQKSFGLRKAIPRDEYVARRVETWCRKNPGKAVVLRRIGAGAMLSAGDIAHYGISQALFSKT